MTLARRAEDVLDRFGDRPRLWFEGVWHSSADLMARTRRTAGGFARLGVRAGDRVVVVMANCPEVGIAYGALWRAGAVPTPALFLLTEEELRHVVSDSGAVAVVTTPEFLPKVSAASAGLPVVVVGGEGGIPWEQLEAADELPLVDRSGDDLAALLLLPLPMAHAYGLLVTVAGLHPQEPSTSYLMRWFDPAGWVALVAGHRIQTSTLVPSMLQLLLAQPLEEHDLSCLVRVSSGAAPLAAEVAREFERRVPGCDVIGGYGCTESSALVSTAPSGEKRPGSVGKPVPGVEVRVELPDGGAAATSVDGEICVRGPNVMQGYWGSPDATAFAVRDGWLHTGDVGHLDEDGWLYVVDRLKDLIIRNGFNVYPRDVEDVLLGHPAVAAAAVVGRPDPGVGEEVVAFVQVSGPVAAEELVAWAKGRLGAHKYPREVRLVDAVPLTSVMKTDRKALRALLT